MVCGATMAVHRAKAHVARAKNPTSVRNKVKGNSMEWDRRCKFLRQLRNFDEHVELLLERFCAAMAYPRPKAAAERKQG